MTRREAIRHLAARLVPLYDPREAHSIALAAAAGISGLTTTALRFNTVMDSVMETVILYFQVILNQFQF